MRLLRASLAAVSYKTMSPRPRDRAMLGVRVRLDAVLEAGRAVLCAGHHRGACRESERVEKRGEGRRSGCRREGAMGGSM